MLFSCIATFTLLLSIFLSPSAAQTCSSSSPCRVGCCSKWGNCGFGPDYCGSNCISDCGRKSDCNPGFGSKWAQKDKCPLNVCCSKHGFCGTTKDFCGDKKVPHKTCLKTNGNSRIIGYYEGWVGNRPCNVFWPEQIPVGLYTHINFAFATIDPSSFKVQPASQTDVGLYRRLMHLKKKDPGLKIFIAIGGWTFNDPGPTARTFSDLAASITKQKAFIESLMSFMSTYGFDGVDLDWEYPVAEDRSGRGVDYANFPKFMSRLKASLDSGQKGLSITLPASFWYLQHFDIIALAKTVHWFNIMSYDLHGTWDKNNTWVGAYLNAHSNLTEIDLALDLLWRNNINPGQVVMGLGFYGRAFTTTSTSCLEPGCTYESGAQKGKCSREVGVLLNSEIDDLVKQHNIKPKLYKKEAVKVAAWGNPAQWVAYDDEETFQLKSEYAQSMCLGGLMIWAISHDTKDSKYNKALAKVANRKILFLPVNVGMKDDLIEFVDVPNEQCRWTNCNVGCAPGWAVVPRSDPGARGKEYMFDQTGCDGTASHAFCCPATWKQPKCGWYTHNNGKCTGSCPDNMVLIGSNKKYCNNGQFQAACCTKDTQSIKLYTLCEPGAFPKCDDQASCPAQSGDQSMKTLLASSSTGIGGAEVCKKRECRIPIKPKSSVMTFSDCQWYSNTGSGSASSREDFCAANCPNDRVRVAMDIGAPGCSGGGKARCCIPNYYETVEVENEKLGVWRDSLKKWLEDPTCENPASILNSQGLLAKAEAHALIIRKPKSGEIQTESLLLALITSVGTAKMQETMQKIWNNGIESKFPNLKMPKFAEWLTKESSFETEGPIETAHQVICSPNYWNKRAGGSSTRKVDCSKGICTTDRGCGIDDADDGAQSAFIRLRDVEQSSVRDYQRGPHDDVMDRRGLVALMYEEDKKSLGQSLKLAKRVTSARDYHPTLISPTGRQLTVTITLPSYNNIRDYEHDDPINDEVLDFVSRGDCTNAHLRHFSLRTGELFEIEHIFDGNIIGRFMQDAASGVLRSGATASMGPISISFFETARTMPLLPNPPRIPGDAQYIRLYDRVMECLGSETNEETIVAVQRDINRVKTSLMRGNQPRTVEEFGKLASNFAQPNLALAELRTAIGVIRYLNYQGVPNVNARLAIIINHVGEQWDHGAATWNGRNPNNHMPIGDYWREWVADFYPWLIRHTESYVRAGIQVMRTHWRNSGEELEVSVLEILRALEAQLGTLQIDTSGFN